MVGGFHGAGKHCENLQPHQPDAHQGNRKENHKRNDYARNDVPNLLSRFPYLIQRAPRAAVPPFVFAAPAFLRAAGFHGFAGHRKFFSKEFLCFSRVVSRSYFVYKYYLTRALSN